MSHKKRVQSKVDGHSRKRRSWTAFESERFTKVAVPLLATTFKTILFLPDAENKILGIQWAMWSKWSRPDNKCEGRRFRQCQNCLADGTCTPIPKFKQSCAGERFETLFYTNKPACSKSSKLSYFLTPLDSSKLSKTPLNSP